MNTTISKVGGREVQGLAIRARRWHPRQMDAPISELDRLIANQIADHPRIWGTVAWLLRLPVSAVSPTWALARLLKADKKQSRSFVIVGLNLFYLILAIGTVSVLIYRFDDDLSPLRAPVWSARCLWAYFLWSRCAEVFIAFYRDAMDWLNGKDSSSDLTGSWRVWLALNSYVELMINYALLYAMLPAKSWTVAPKKISETLWISASTITTSGGGGFTPAHWLPQLLSTLEIFGGVILLVVCFTLYAGGRADKRRHECQVADKVSRSSIDTLQMDN